MRIKDLITLKDSEFSVEKFKELHELISANVPEGVYVSMHSHARTITLRRDPHSGAVCEHKKERIYRVSFTYGRKWEGREVFKVGALSINADEYLIGSPFLMNLEKHLKDRK